MPNERARAIGEALSTAVVGSLKDHLALADDLHETLSLSNGTDSAHRSDGEGSPDLSDELEFLSAFIGLHVVNVAFASEPQFRSDVLQEFREQYLELQPDEERSHVAALLEDRFRRYETALSTCRASEREDDVLARAFADVCGRTEYDFWSVASDIVAEELIAMRGLLRQGL